MKFKAGDRIRCVHPGPSKFLVVGTVYTVAKYTASQSEFLQVKELLGLVPAHTYRESWFELVTETKGRKDDGGKLDFTLLDDMPNALEAVVEVMQWAVTKKAPVPYERGSWQAVHPDRYRAAIQRHDKAACVQFIEALVGKAHSKPSDVSLEPRFQRDAETELLHLAHIATSALMALESTIRELKKDKQ